MIALLVALLVQQTDAAPPAKKLGVSGDPMARYLTDLEKAGVLAGDKTPATLEKLREELAAAEDDLVTGNAEIASVRLYKIVESQRYLQFEYAPDYATAELTLARALIRAGGSKSAERYLLRVLARGPKAPQFAPPTVPWSTLRSRRRKRPRCSAVLDHYDQERGEALPRDSAAEHAYLAGKVAYETGDGAHAEALFSAVDRQSRFYAAALYFRGLIQARQESLRLGAPQPLRDRRAGRPGPLHLLHRRALLRGQGLGLSGARPDRPRAGEVRRRLLLLLPRPHRFGSLAGRALRGVVVDVPEGGVRGGARLSRGIRSQLPGLAAGARRDAAACDDRPQVLPVRHRARDAGQVRPRSTGRSRSRWRGCSRIPAKRGALYRRLLSKASIATPHDPIADLLKVDPRFYKFYGDIQALDREAGVDPQRGRHLGRADRAQKDSGETGGSRTPRRRCAWCRTSSRCARWPPAIRRWKNA